MLALRMRFRDHVLGSSLELLVVWALSLVIVACQPSAPSDTDSHNDLVQGGRPSDNSYIAAFVGVNFTQVKQKLFANDSITPFEIKQKLIDGKVDLTEWLTDEDMAVFVGSGFLIDRRHFLSVAHVVEVALGPMNPANMIFFVVSRADGRQQAHFKPIEVSYVVHHPAHVPNYNYSNFDVLPHADVGLAILSSDAPGPYAALETQVSQNPTRGDDVLTHCGFRSLGFGPSIPQPTDGTYLAKEANLCLVHPEFILQPAAKERFAWSSCMASLKTDANLGFIKNLGLHTVANFAAELSPYTAGWNKLSWNNRHRWPGKSKSVLDAGYVIKGDSGGPILNANGKVVSLISHSYPDFADNCALQALPFKIAAGPWLVEHQHFIQAAQNCQPSHLPTECASIIQAAMNTNIAARGEVGLARAYPDASTDVGVYSDRRGAMEVVGKISEARRTHRPIGWTQSGWALAYRDTTLQWIRSADLRAERSEGAVPHDWLAERAYSCPLFQWSSPTTRPQFWRTFQANELPWPIPIYHLTEDYAVIGSGRNGLNMLSRNCLGDIHRWKDNYQGS